MLGWRDWLVVSSIGFNVGARFLTIYLTTSIPTLGATAAGLESNPIERLLQSMALLQLVGTAVIYGLLISMYLFVRKKWGSGSTATNLLVATFFMLSLMDFSNDLAVFLSTMK